METLLLFSAGGSMCTDVPMRGPGWWWAQKFTGKTGRILPETAHWVLCIHCFLPCQFSQGSLGAVRITLLRQGSGTSTSAVMYPVTPGKAMLFIPSDSRGKCAWLQAGHKHVVQGLTVAALGVQPGLFQNFLWWLITVWADFHIISKRAC